MNNSEEIYNILFQNGKIKHEELPEFIQRKYNL
jgi:phage-related protein